MARSNRLFGGTRAVLAALEPTFRTTTRDPLTVLDVGTGLGDIPASIRARARRLGVRVLTFGLESSEALARAACGPGLPMVRADARALPFADRSVDVACCSQVLHHFELADALRLLRELDRVARARVIVSDLRRSWVAAGGIWLASFALGFHAVSRHDGVVSVLRGFTRRELRELVHRAIRRDPAVRYGVGFRAVATWTPTASAT